VLLLVSHLVRRAHHGAAVVLVLATLADSDTPVGGLAERVAVLGIGEEQRRHRPRCPLAAEPEVPVERRRVDDLARVHPVLGVEQCLDVLEQRDHLLAEHPREELTAGLAVAVLAGQGAAVRRDQVSGSLQEPPVGRHTLGAVEVEGDPRVDTALPEVTVETRTDVGGVAEVRVEPAQVAQVVTEAVDRHG